MEDDVNNPQPMIRPALLRARHHATIFHRFQQFPLEFTDRQWQAISLTYEYGLTRADVAALLGLSPNSVSGLLTRARQKLERRWKQVRKESYEIQRSAETE